MKNNLYQAFGDRVRALRLIAGITQEELAFRANLSSNYISDVERGVRNVSLKAIYQIAYGLKVTIDTLFLQ